MGHPVTFRTVLVPGSVMDAVVQYEDVDLEAVMKMLYNVNIPVLWEDCHKVGVARNFEITDRGLLAELTVIDNCRDCSFTLTSLTGDSHVSAYGGSRMDSAFVN